MPANIANSEVPICRTCVSSRAIRGREIFQFSSKKTKMAPKVKAPKPVENNTQLGPQAREGEEVFGVAHIFASFNDTFVVSWILAFYPV